METNWVKFCAESKNLPWGGDGGVWSEAGCPVQGLAKPSQQSNTLGNTSGSRETQPVGISEQWLVRFYSLFRPQRLFSKGRWCLPPGKLLRWIVGWWLEAGTHPLPPLFCVFWVIHPSTLIFCYRPTWMETCLATELRVTESHGWTYIKNFPLFHKKGVLYRI